MMSGCSCAVRSKWSNRSAKRLGEGRLGDEGVDELRIVDVTASPNPQRSQVNTLSGGSGGALPPVVVFAGHANNQLTS